MHVTYSYIKLVTIALLRLQNIMFESKKKDAEIKLIDFGLSKKYLPGSVMSEGVGTVYT